MTNQNEKRICQNCRGEFTIEPDDFNFYEKIKVPPPTFCPECRMVRRTMFRNERVLYKQLCNLCNKNIISIYSPRAKFPVFCNECWWSDQWDAEKHSQLYDFSRSFFEQFKELIDRVPRVNLEGSKNTNCEYTNFTWESKNCYLAPSTLFSEDIYYSKSVDKSQDCLDCFQLTNSQLCYECINTNYANTSYFLFNCQNCIGSAFLFDCVNCQHCILSANLRNKNFVIRNRQLSKDDYLKALKDLSLDSIGGIEKAKLDFKGTLIQALHKYARIIKSVDTWGDNISNAKNTKNCFDVYNVEDIKYSARVYNIKNSFDLYGDDDAELDYEILNGGLFSSRTKFCTHTYTNCSDIQYSDCCKSSSNLFACVGLRNKQYCILNKQYTKEEYEALVPKIIQHMNDMPYVDKKGRIYKYGEFFPPELSPFAYNETIAQEYFPLTKEQAIEQGYRWKDPEPRNYQIDIKTEDLPDNIKDVTDDIIGKVIECAHHAPPAGGCNEQCTEAFKIIPDELTFYKRMNLPLPRLCPNCRHYQRLKQRNPLKLWHCRCMCDKTNHHNHLDIRCPNEFETSYAPERQEIIYCEKCYQQEVY